MNIAIPINDFDPRCLQLEHRVPNTVIDDSWFRRVNYSNNDLTLNGLYLYVPLNICSVERYFNKVKYSYKTTDNAATLDNITSIEKRILDCVCPVGDGRTRFIPVPKLREQLYTGSVRLFTNYPTTEAEGVILKIAGVWETGNTYGITFKFLDVSHPSKST